MTISVENINFPRWEFHVNEVFDKSYACVFNCHVKRHSGFETDKSGDSTNTKGRDIYYMSEF